MLQAQFLQCPYCGEAIELVADGSAGAQEYIEDCPVCCRPMRVLVHVDQDGDVSLRVLHEDEA